MAIYVDVKMRPDFSAFRTPTVEDLVQRLGCDEVMAAWILENYTILPR